MIFFVVSIFPVLRWLFLCLKINKVGDLPKNGVQLYVQGNIKEVVYLGLTERLDQIIDSYKKNNSEKANYLKKAFDEIRWCSLIFLAFIITFILDKF